MNSSRQASPGAARHRDDGRSLHAFIDVIDVACPRCAQHAMVRGIEVPRPRVQTTSPARLSCNHCGLVRTQQLARDIRWSYHLRTDGNDPYFRLPLWLQAPTRHGLVFAYNERHLETLESIVGAKLRERHTNPVYRKHNGTMASRLPHWMKIAKNRDDILGALARMRARLERSTDR